MKIHGTAKGGALSKKDFGVAFSSGGGGTPECDSNISWDTGTNYLNTTYNAGTNVTSQDATNFGGDKSIATSDSSFEDSGKACFTGLGNSESNAQIEGYFGLSSASITSINNLKFAFAVINHDSTSEIDIYEGGSEKHTSGTAIEDDTELHIVLGSDIKYYINDELEYTSETTPSGAYFVACGGRADSGTDFEIKITSSLE